MLKLCETDLYLKGENDSCVGNERTWQIYYNVYEKGSKL